MQIVRPRRLFNPLDNPYAIDRSRRIVIAGGAGFLGSAVSSMLARDGREIVILSRRPAPTYGKVRTVVWDGRTVGDWAQELTGAAAVVNLTGRSVACRYTPQNQQEILASRVDSVNAIDLACVQCDDAPPVVVQASSLALYGDTGDQICDETARHGDGFAAEVVEKWEHTFFCGTEDQRRVALRIGFVLGPNGGALEPLAKLARCYLGGAAGDGRQYISWLHLNDFCAMVRWAIENTKVEGAYNATGLNPVTNEEFMRAVRKAVGRPWSPRTPAWAVKFGAKYVMRVDPSLVLTGRRCIPKKLLDEGFRLQHSSLEQTLWELLTQTFENAG